MRAERRARRAVGRASRRAGLRAALVVLAAIACGPGAGAESLRAALARAYASNPALNAERARQRADDEAVPQALSGYRPRVGATLDAGLQADRDTLSRRERRQIVADALAGAGDDPAARAAALRAARRETRPQTGLTRSLSGEINVGQTLFDGGRTSAAVGVAESQVLAGRQVLRGVEQDILLGAATAYADVVQAQANVALQRGSIVFLDEVVRQSRKRYETGATGPADLAQAEARRARGGADLSTAEANLIAARAAYRAAIGAEPAGLPSAFADELAAFGRAVERLLPDRIGPAVATGLREHPSVRAAAHSIDAAVEAERLAAAAFQPTVTLQGALTPSYAGTSDRDGGGSAPGSAAAGLQVNAPLYDGGATAAAVRQAKEQSAQARLDLETARDQVRSDVTTALGNYEAAGAAIAAGEVAVRANEVALEGVQREQLEGQRTTLEVLNAQQELLGARTRLVQSRRDRLVGSYALLAAIGRLSAAHLGLTRQEYRPDTHYRQVRDLWSGKRTPDGR